MCVNNLSKVALDSAAAGIEHAISSRKSNAITTTPPSHIVDDVSDGFYWKMLGTLIVLVMCCVVQVRG